MRVPKKPSGRRAMPFYWWRRFRSHKNLPYKSHLIDKIQNVYKSEDAAGVGIITKQNTTKDVKPGDEYKNVKKLHLSSNK